MSPSTTPASPSAAPPTSAAKRTRKRGLWALTALVVASGLAVMGYRWVNGQHIVTTDNAYVGGHVVQITAQIPGTVTAIAADNNDRVQAGQVLVQLDASDARIDLQEAEAELAQAVREVRSLFAASTTLQSQIATREADVARLQANLQKSEADVRRRSELVRIGAVGREEFEHLNAELASARHALAAAKSAVQTARDELAGSRVRIEGTDVDNHPNVQRAAAKVRAAYLDLHRADLQAPVDGQITQRTVQLGQRIQAGAPLMSVVPMEQLWVDANFKESQIGMLKVGQPATLTADVYGKQVVYRGHVAGVGAGTGAAFALLPAQNATGNWIKIVQRVPVRIALDPQDLKQHPLRIGLSMIASVNTAANASAPPTTGGVEPATPAASAQDVQTGKDTVAATTPINRATAAEANPNALARETPSPRPQTNSKSVSEMTMATSQGALASAAPDLHASANGQPEALAQGAEAHVRAIIARHARSRS